METIVDPLFQLVLADGPDLDGAERRVDRRIRRVTHARRSRRNPARLSAAARKGPLNSSHDAADAARSASSRIS